MKKHSIILRLLLISSLILYSIALLWVRYKYFLNSSFCLPYRKAQVAPSSSLPRARNSTHYGVALGRLESGVT